MVLVSYIVMAELPFFWLICWWQGRLPRIWRPASMLFYLMAMTLGYFVAVLELNAAPIIGAGLLTIFVNDTDGDRDGGLPDADRGQKPA